MIPSRAEFSFDVAGSDHYKIQHGPDVSCRYYYMTGDEVEYNNNLRIDALNSAREKGVRYDPQDITADLEEEKRANAQKNFPKAIKPVKLECEEDL